MVKFITYIISAAIAAFILGRFANIDYENIPQMAINALTLISLYEICKHEEKRGE
jgi:xanthine/uracil/vitamin C permease (AzgA family)